MLANTKTLKVLSRKRNEDEEDGFHNREPFLSWTEEPLGTRCEFPIDEVFTTPQYYRHAAKRISTCGPNDIVQFNICSPGGRFDGLSLILSAISDTPANTIAHIQGECHSAASMLALSCNNVIVSPYASMLVHYISYGAVGKGSDIYQKVHFTQRNSIDVFKEIYKGFLTEDEMEMCILGHEYWFDADDICLRLESRDELLGVDSDSCEGYELNLERLE